MSSQGAGSHLAKTWGAALFMCPVYQSGNAMYMFKKGKSSRVKANAHTFTHYKLPIVPYSTRTHTHTHTHRRVKGLTPLQLHSIFNVPPRLLRCVVARITGSAPWTFNPNVLFVSAGPPLSRLTRGHTRGELAVWVCVAEARTRRLTLNMFARHSLLFLFPLCIFIEFYTPPHTEALAYFSIILSLDAVGCN